MGAMRRRRPPRPPAPAGKGGPVGRYLLQHGPQCGPAGGQGRRQARKSTLEVLHESDGQCIIDAYLPAGHEASDVGDKSAVHSAEQVRLLWWRVAVASVQGVFEPNSPTPLTQLPTARGRADLGSFPRPRGGARG